MFTIKNNWHQTINKTDNKCNIIEFKPYKQNIVNRLNNKKELISVCNQNHQKFLTPNTNK